MKIKGWDKISGYTYKGYCIVNPIHNAGETKYEATVLNLNLPQKPKWELVVLTPAFKFKHDDVFSIMLWDENKLHTTTTINVQAMKSISHFRQTFEQLVDRMLSLHLTSAPRSQSMYYPANYGIINHVNNSGNVVTYNPTSHTNLPSAMIDAMKDLQKQIDNLKNNNANN